MGEVKVNKAQYDAVSEERREGVFSALREAGVLKPDDTVVGDETVAPERPEREEEDWGDVPDDVVDACYEAAALAYAACLAAGGHSVQCGQLMKHVFESCLASWG